MKAPRSAFAERLLTFLGAVSVTFVVTSCSNNPVVPVEDDWQHLSPNEAGMDPQMLSQLDTQIRAGSYGTIQSLLVIRHGSLVMEEYYNGASRSSLHQLYSVTKSVNGALVGIAQAHGDITNLHTEVLSYFPEYESVAAGDSVKNSMTVENLLMMASGLKWDELSISYSEPANSFVQMVSSKDWIQYVFQQPMATTPGTSFTYNTGCSVVLGEVVHRATRTDVKTYADTHLFKPLGITDWQWLDAPNGVTNTGSGLFLSPRDMAKFGQLYLQNGLWNGQQLVPQNWVTASTTRHITASGTYGYGYQWWLMPTSIPLTHESEDVAIAWGWADQFIFVIRSLDMIVVSTAYNETGPHVDAAISFVPQYVIGAVRAF
jgi:CubicO group peptidase (beta-lactamase class C family)